MDAFSLANQISARATASRSEVRAEAPKLLRAEGGHEEVPQLPGRGLCQPTQRDE